MILEQLYTELGKLIYAVALCDGIVQQKEINKLEKIISKEVHLKRRNCLKNQLNN